MTYGYDPVEDLRKVTSVQKKWRDAFATGALDSRKWTSQVAAGGAITVNSGALTLSSGANANDETWVLSTESFTVPFRVSVGLALSQRIANQSFYLEAVSVDRDSGQPDGQHMLGLLFDGVTATQAKYEVQAGGMVRLTSAASTFPTSAAGGVYELEAFIDEAWFHGATMDATSARANSYRRHQQIPDPNALYKVRLRWLNGTTAPASSTNAVLAFITVQDYAELTAEITAGRGQSVAGQGVAVQVAGSLAGASAVFVQGAAARSAASNGNPLYVATGLSANPTAIATGRNVDLMATLIGALVTKPYSIPEADWVYASALTGVATGADTAVRAAVASNRQYLTGLQLQNLGTAATEFQVKDGATVIWRASLPAGMANPVAFDFPTPLRATTNTALNVQAVTASSAVVVNAQGYQAP